MACASLQGGTLSIIIMGARVRVWYLVINIIKYLGATSGIFLLLMVLTGYLVIINNNNIIKYLGAPSH